MQEKCQECNDNGRVGICNGQIVYCDCRCGIAAELEDRDRVLQAIAENLATMPVFECNRIERESLQATHDRLASEYAKLERAYWQEMVVS